MYAKSEAISHGAGNCMQCGRNVERILIGDRAKDGHREWRIVEWQEARGVWLSHTCPRKPDPESARKAA